MSDANGIDTALLSNPVPSPLIDHDEPATEQDKPAPAAEAQKTDTPDATDENAETQESKEGDEERKQSRRQRKLERERDARIRAETRAEMLEKELAAARASKAETKEAGEPKREDFEDYESYLRAVTRYDAAQEAAKTLKADREASQQREARTTEQSAQQKMAEEWTKREKEYIAKNPTFEEDVNDFLDGDLTEFSQQARMAIVELGPEVLHYLATHEDEAEEIAKLSPLRQVAALGRIDTNKSETSGDVSTERKPERKPAPPPAKHVRGGNSAPAALSDDMDTYIQQRAKQGARWARH